MKKLIPAIFVLSLTATAFAVEPAIPRDENIERRVEETLKKMSLDDKIGQMLQLQIDVVGNGAAPFHLDEAKMDEVIGKYRTGSFLNTPLGFAGSLEGWREWIPQLQKSSMKHLGIPTIFGLDNNHGSMYIQGGTLYPQPINQGASFDTDMAMRLGAITAYESRAADCPWVFNPVVDLCRDPRWSRMWESYGEDAIVNSKMAVAALKGLQGDDPNHIGKYNVATSMKHYMAYGAPFTGKDRTQLSQVRRCGIRRSCPGGR